VSNGSDRPITDVDVDFGDLTADQVRATRVPDHRIVDVPCGIGPSQAYQFTSENSSMERVEEIAVTSVFTDASGVSWRLTEDNFLSEI
jgi:type 1 fimbria pilin